MFTLWNSIYKYATFESLFTYSNSLFQGDFSILQSIHSKVDKKWYPYGFICVTCVRVRIQQYFNLSRNEYIIKSVTTCVLQKFLLCTHKIREITWFDSIQHTICFSWYQLIVYWSKLSYKDLSYLSSVMRKCLLFLPVDWVSFGRVLFCWLVRRE